MSFDYTYIKNIASIKKFRDYILLTLNTLLSVTYDSSSKNLTLEFPQELVTGDKTILDDLITNYTNPPDDPSYTTSVLNSTLIKTTNTNWTSICTWIESGVQNLYKIDIYSKLTAGINDDIFSPEFKYEFRIVNTTTNTILKQEVFTNSEYILNSISDINFSSNDILELQVSKGLSGTEVCIFSIIGNYT